MTVKKTEAFKPCVTMEQIYAFDAQRPETFTVSPLMNAVLTAVKREKFTQLTDVARYLRLNVNHLSGAVRIIIGMRFDKMRDQLFRHTVEELKKEHPDWDTTQLAQAVGYSDSSALWRLFHREYDHTTSTKSGTMPTWKSIHAGFPDAHPRRRIAA